MATISISNEFDFEDLDINNYCKYSNEETVKQYFLPNLLLLKAIKIYITIKSH